jgi:hypothetical protein
MKKRVRLVLLTTLGVGAGALGIARANAPAGRFTTTSEVVTDNVTGLKWQANVLSTFDHPSAVAYCASLGIGGFAAGWRLPTSKELVSLVDFRATSLLMDTTAFPPSTPAAPYWASEAWATTDFMVVDFSNGTVSEANANGSLHVRCVHD